MSQSAGFRCDSFKDIVGERVHDGHSFGADSSIGVNLFQDFVDVDSITFLPLTSLFLVRFGDVFLGFTGLFGGLSASFRRHVDGWNSVSRMAKKPAPNLYI